MNLQEFITTVIVDIMTGVANARDLAKPMGGTVGSNEAFGHPKEAKIITDNYNRPVTNIEFDIALAESDSTNAKGGIGVFLGAIGGLGGQMSNKGETSTHTRVKFSIPVVFPGKNPLVD